MFDRSNGYSLLPQRIKPQLEALPNYVTDCPLVVAVSGGPDSLALLLALMELKKPLGLQLHIAHLNHSLRDEAADEDAAFVQQLGKDFHVQATIEKEDVGKLRRDSRLTLEEAGREARLEFLSRVAYEIGAKAVVLGHTADDQCETILMHLIRGTGLSGAQGMLPVTAWRSNKIQQGILLLRPLLETYRDEIESYCETLGFVPRRDSSNDSVEFTRNRLRHEIIPSLEKVNRKVKQALLRFRKTVERDLNFIERQTDQAWEQVVRRQGAVLVFDNTAMKALDIVLQAHLITRAYHVETGSSRGLQGNHIDSVLSLVARTKGEQHLPNGIVARLQYGSLQIGRAVDVLVNRARLLKEYRVCVPGETVLEGWRVIAAVEESGAPDMERSHESACFDMDGVGRNLIVRSRRPGDRFQPLGMARAKKLQDFMTDEKIPRQARDGIPLVISPRGIAWVVGSRIAEWARLTEDTRKIVRLTFQKI